MAANLIKTLRYGDPECTQVQSKLMRLVRFLKAAGTKGIGLMTGGLLSFAISAYEHWKGSSIAAISFTGVAIVAVLFGSYLAWSEEHAEKEALKTQQYLPNMSITLHSVSMAQIPNEPNGAIMVLTILSVRNTGAPSTLDEWWMAFDDYPGLKIKKMTAVEDMVWSYPNGINKYPAGDQIHTKIAENPVPTGGKKIGFMAWQVEGLDMTPFLEDKTKMPSLTITARDVTGKLVVSTNKAKDRDDSGRYYPGMTSHLQKP